ncbi:hypothetical protein LWP59_18765 [Amycolatopsis acidiphila]|uniref:hypothetical protein n=1 Tax=Amycolatopsis acidiphila TaxID=715473 RepID=UPI001643A4AC|nr:hypothetical protein [Amycolatopsis acidiphila]UIJ63523.1 hypothetical protein LWP59_18765 [Amycolatopsis acidiphila]GHG68464.1 hypothetical protein GCM10017788_28170 [Amycolatopsis acidiphila]
MTPTPAPGLETGRAVRELLRLAAEVPAVFARRLGRGAHAAAWADVLARRLGVGGVGAAVLALGHLDRGDRQ